jgi:hypothetical protein
MQKTSDGILEKTAEKFWIPTEDFVSYLEDLAIIRDHETNDDGTYYKQEDVQNWISSWWTDKELTSPSKKYKWVEV